MSLHVVIVHIDNAPTRFNLATLQSANPYAYMDKPLTYDFFSPKC